MEPAAAWMTCPATVMRRTQFRAPVLQVVIQTVKRLVKVLRAIPLPVYVCVVVVVLIASIWAHAP